jgi:glutamate synthase (NADPH/NADH) large chain
MEQVNKPAATNGTLKFLLLTDSQATMIHDLIAKHVEETGSKFAAKLLEDWEHTKARITHVVPSQYVAMTAAMESAASNDVDFEQPGAWENVYETVMEGAH